MSLPLALAVSMLASLALADEIQFVHPLDGSQTVGRMAIEVRTSVANVDRVEFFVDGTLIGVARKSPYRVEFDFGDAIERHSVSAVAHYDHFRSRAETSITTAGLTIEDAIDVDLVEVPLHIQSRRRAPERREIRIFENGVEQSVLELRNSRGPTHFVFIVDRSLSMSDGKLDAVNRALGQIRTRFRAGDKAEIIYFNHRVERPYSLSAPSTIKEITPAGGTALRDALSQIRVKSSTIAIVISDGADRNSLADENSTLRHLANGRLTLYAISLGEGNATALLRRAAEQSGGQMLRSDSGRVLSALEQLFAAIDNRWIAVYQSRGNASGWRTIRVESTRRSTRVAANRKGYFAE